MTSGGRRPWRSSSSRRNTPPAFRALNEAWITKYFALEAKDREVLDDPQGKIVEPGGRIFMAFEDGEPVGCVALMRMADGGYEVAKMTVLETLRGSGLGRLLMQRCIDAGRRGRARRGSIWRPTPASPRRWPLPRPWASPTPRAAGAQRLRPRRHLDGAAST